MNIALSTAALIIHKGNFDKFVAVHRKEDASLVCLPGGKVDPGEHVVEAVVREVFEETGLVVSPENCVPFFSDLCVGSPTSKDYLATVFLINVEDEVLSSQESDMKPFWTSRENFFKHSTFKDFNEATFAQLDKLYPNK